MGKERKAPERSFIRELVPDWRPTREQALWAVRITLILIVLLGVLELIGDYYGKTLWNWATILLVPAVLAIGGYWFNRSQQVRQQEQQSASEALEERRTRHNEIVKALQGEKEPVAYVAFKVRKGGLPNDKERRAQLLTALYLAILFQHADRTRALVFSALRDSYHNKHGEEVMETLRRLKRDFTRYKEDLADGQKRLKEKEAISSEEAFNIGIDKHIIRLKILEEALENGLPEQKEMGSVSQETKEPQ
jgi:hypothetical protein